jgi:hypothetical protein
MSPDVSETPKIDYKKQLHPLYSGRAQAIDEVNVPAINYLMADGAGNPNTSASYAQLVEALFALSYALKFSAKQGALGEKPRDYTVMPLEGLWWTEDMDNFSVYDKGAWQWTMMIAQPPFITAENVHSTRNVLDRKKKLPALSVLRFETLVEGRCAQTLHVGPFSEEGPTIKGLHDYIDAKSGRRGKHHEIYLSDIRRTTPAKWRTIIRHPMG